MATSRNSISKALTVPALLLAVLCLSLSPVTKASAAMPRGSFMTSYCATPDKMVEKLKTQPEILHRYVLAWNLSSKSVLERISFLHLGYMPTDGFANVHYWRNNHDNVKKERLRMGTAVFFDVTGHPFVKCVCGNPISVFRPAPTPAIARLGSASSPELPAPPTASVDDVMDNIPSRLASTESDVLQPAFAAPSITGETSSGIGAFTGPSLASVGTVAAPIVHAGLGSTLLGATTVGLITINHHGADTSGGGVTQIIIPPVPEPSLTTFLASLLALLGGAILLGRYKSRREATR